VRHVATAGSNAVGQLGTGLVPSEQPFSDQLVESKVPTSAVELSAGCEHAVA
jgi:hypothetical protein